MTEEELEIMQESVHRASDMVEILYYYCENDENSKITEPICTILKYMKKELNTVCDFF